ncbi:MAG: nuclear transport factor 2 family protein [Ekhidna sp.]
MKINILLFALTLICIQEIAAQSEVELIRSTLNDYIEGSTQGQPNRLKKAFHPDLNLYYVRNDQVRIWSGKEYILDTEEGKPTGEKGKILSIDYENNAGMAKVEIFNPKNNDTYIDYFMLLKTNGKWTIIHKMFTKKKE